MLGSHRLPAPRHIPAEPDRPHRRPGHQGDHRERSGHRGELSPPRRARVRPRQRRGHLVRRRDQQSSAADAVRRRPGRAPDRDGHRRGGGQPRRRREPQRPSGTADHLVHAAAPRPMGEGRPRGHAALAADPPRPADEQHGGVGWLRPLRARSVRAGPAAACAPGPVRQPGPGRPGPARDDGACRPGRRGQPGADQAAQRRSEAPSGHRSRLPVRRPGQPGAGGRAEDGQGVRDGQADGGDLRQRAGPGRARTVRYRARRVRPDQRGDPLPSGRHLRDGRRLAVEQRARSRAPGPWRHRAAGSRRIGDAGRAAREHQRAHDRDRRARRRPHRRPGAAGRDRPRRPRRRHGDRLPPIPPLSPPPPPLPPPPRDPHHPATPTAPPPPAAPPPRHHPRGGAHLSAVLVAPTTKTAERSAKRRRPRREAPSVGGDGRGGRAAMSSA